MPCRLVIFKMKKIAMLGLILITACGPTPTAAPISSNNPFPITVTPQVAISTTAIPTAIIQPTATVVSLPATSESLWLQVLSPLDEDVVTTPQVDVTGSAPAGTVISINDQILTVGIDGQFKTTVTLEEGPNLIEVVASDENGNEMTVLLTVTYEP